MNTSSTSSSSPSGLPAGSGKITLSASYYLSFVVLGLAGASLGPTLPALAEQTNSQLSQISFLFTARLLGYLLGSLIGGPIFDRVRGNPVMVLALLIMAAALALTPMLPILWLLAVVLLVLGIGEGTLNVGGNALLVWVHGDRVGPFMNGMHFVFGVGSFLAPVIVAQSILMTDGIRWAYWLLALLMFPVAFLLIRLKSPVRPDIPQERSDGQSNAWLVGLMILFFFLHVGALVCIGGWLFTYTVALNPGSQAMAAYLTAAFWAALTIGRLISIPIAARVKPGSILLFDMIGSLICLGLIVVLAGSSSALWVGTIGMGLSMATIYPISICLMQERMNLSGKVAGWIFAGGCAGGMILPWLIGQLFEPVGPQVTMLVILATMAAALVVLVALLSLAPARQQEPCASC